MGTKFTLCVERIGADGTPESNVYLQALQGDSIAEFRITPPGQAQGAGTAMHYLLFRNGANAHGGYGLLTVGKDQGVPSFAYRYAVDNDQLAELLMADGLSAVMIEALARKINEPLSAPNKAAEAVLTDVLNRLTQPPPRQQPRNGLPALLRPKPGAGGSEPA